ncbi:FBD-associated F-box protein At4g10400-like [Lotus japonicus]|uniref:FBD-associated F-box protein At4g10400-like n=1 Tax=Lotus japonicus TaxID=34305 RepID=UPI00258A0367|nr:FBD-associated F-box protein At4g10400-like [Lotus japonicus]
MSMKKKKMNMEDRISGLPDEILCNILSFLPTKEAIATSALSKRWIPLWRSVSTLDFNFTDAKYLRSTKRHSRFVESVYAFILSRDFHQPFHQPITKFRLSCHHVDELTPSTLTVWVNAALQRRVQHLDISLPGWYNLSNSSSIFSCKTLVVLKLEGLQFKTTVSSVDLPFLKVLHLRGWILCERGCLAELLSGCPVLEELKASNIFFGEPVARTEFKTLPKLVRADISESISGSSTNPFMMKVVNNAHFLKLSQIYTRVSHDVEAMFHNLTRIELGYLGYVSDWFEVVRFLKYCPKLQVLVINQPGFHEYDLDRICRNIKDCQDPSFVPNCILQNLKECYLNDYRGTNCEFQFAKYIMRNGRFLKRMTICSSTAGEEEERLKNIQKLSSYTSFNLLRNVSVLFVHKGKNQCPTSSSPVPSPGTFGWQLTNGKEFRQYYQRRVRCIFSNTFAIVGLLTRGKGLAGLDNLDSGNLDDLDSKERVRF